MILSESILLISKQNFYKKIRLLLLFIKKFLLINIIKIYLFYLFYFQKN